MSELQEKVEELKTLKKELEDFKNDPDNYNTFLRYDNLQDRLEGKMDEVKKLSKSLGTKDGTLKTDDGIVSVKTTERVSKSYDKDSVVAIIGEKDFIEKIAMVDKKKLESEFEDKIKLIKTMEKKTLVTSVSLKK